MKDGCPSKGWCKPFEPTSKCQEGCPVHCNTDEIHCPGEEDHMGCKMPDSCMPSKNEDCPAFCPVHCKDNEMMCPGGVDGNGCPMPDTCMWVVESSTVVLLWETFFLLWSCELG